MTCEQAMKLDPLIKSALFFNDGSVWLLFDSSAYDQCGRLNSNSLSNVRLIEERLRGHDDCPRSYGRRRGRATRVINRGDLQCSTE